MVQKRPLGATKQPLRCKKLLVGVPVRKAIGREGGFNNHNWVLRRNATTCTAVDATCSQAQGEIRSPQRGNMHSHILLKLIVHARADPDVCTYSLRV